MWVRFPPGALKMTRLSKRQTVQKLKGFSEWKVEKGRLVKVFEFGNFKEGLEFVGKVGKVAEGLNHHPDISLFDYKKVKVATTTHSEGGLTEKDFTLAREIEKILD